MLNICVVSSQIRTKLAFCVHMLHSDVYFHLCTYTNLFAEEYDI